MILPSLDRPYVSKLLMKLPEWMFPNYRIAVSPVIHDSNREASIFFSEDRPKIFEDFSDSLSSVSDDSEGKITVITVEMDYGLETIVECEASTSASLKEDQLLQNKQKTLLGKTPLSQITSRELKSVKLRPVAASTIPKTPERPDLMATLRKRFEANHSPSFDDVLMCIE
ncbi:uncharacterized protein LOC126741312 isoform X1 [Anthonomus grandis grandis]|uniref:uncharacterized protein LOC126741312 isoform X1 n=1 Tax=Anthonomus grandis grandis TaxID=2921223 RepID=UPI0021658E6C|nr:uncharacterized protein LOC126741312 isoform X1 [Anthonomus grandis grandis]